MTEKNHNGPEKGKKAKKAPVSREYRGRKYKGNVPKGETYFLV